MHVNMFAWALFTGASDREPIKEKKIFCLSIILVGVTFVWLTFLK